MHADSSRGDANTTIIMLTNDTHRCVCVLALLSEFTPEGRRVTKLDSILLNGNNIAIVRTHARSTHSHDRHGSHIRREGSSRSCTAELIMVSAPPLCSAPLVPQLVPGGAPDAK